VSNQTPPKAKKKNNNSKNPVMDSSHPYFVHQSNHPSPMLVPINLNGINYPSWSKSMIHALTAKNEVSFINGSIQPPLETEQPTEYALWNRCNNMILSWLAHSMEHDLAKAIVHAKLFIKCAKISKTSFHKRMHQPYIRYKNPSPLSHKAS
jgi:hypothetical protein